jgi:hypothetical protein
MASGYEEIDLGDIRTASISDRESKVTVEDMGRPVKGGKAFRRWLDSLPDQLAVARLRTLVHAMRRARSAKGREILWMSGAHVIKCGLSRYIIDLMRKGYVSALALNGAGIIHDLELAFFGGTSEDVSSQLERGEFGFAAETAELLFEAVRLGSENGLGLGECVGRFIDDSEAAYRDISVTARAVRERVPVTVHVAVGTDIVCQHEGFEGAKWGALSARDFRIFAARVRSLGENGGVVLNAGSAVILPEVFLKAMSVARNLGAGFGSITACNLDMIGQYRPAQNVLSRPASFGGEAISLTGHHEIMIPLIYSALLS